MKRSSLGETSFEDYLGPFINHLRASGLSDGRISPLRLEARHFLLWLQRHRIPIGEVDHRVLRRFRHHDCRCPGMEAQRRKVLGTSSRRFMTGALKLVRFLEGEGLIGHPGELVDNLDHLETQRQNTISTRNVRLAAIKSFFRYLAYRAPSCLDLAQQVHAMPMKRHDVISVPHVERDEIRALLDAPDTATAAGRRDRAMLHLAYAAGLRVSELITVMVGDLGYPHLDTVHVTGKGRRRRVLPLWKETRTIIRDWLAVRPPCRSDHLFLNARRGAMSRHGFAHRLSVHAATAAETVPAIGEKRIFPHILRHSCAFHTLEATGDIRKVSLWLGHASIQSTEIYLRSDPVGKLEILGQTVPPSINRGTFKDATDRVIAVLQEARNPQ